MYLRGKCTYVYMASLHLPHNTMRAHTQGWCEGGDGRGGVRDGRGGVRDGRGGVRDGRGGVRDGRGGVREVMGVVM